MSELKVEVVKIDNIKAHPNADNLELAIIRGWQVVVHKNEFKVGDLAVYFPIDSILPVELSDSYLILLKIFNKTSFSLW